MSKQGCMTEADLSPDETDGNDEFWVSAVAKNWCQQCITIHNNTFTPGGKTGNYQCIFHGNDDQWTSFINITGKQYIFGENEGN